MMDRREFLKSGAALAGAVAAMPTGATAAPRVDLPLGFMLHALRATAATDFPGTLKRVAALGSYREIEMVSFKGYGTAARDPFLPLANMSGAEARQIVRDAGFAVRSCHYRYAQFSTPQALDESIAWAKDLGTEYITLGDIAPVATLDDWTRHFDNLNQYGEAIGRAGMKLGMFTPTALWRPVDGQLAIERLIAAVPANRCQVEVDLSATQSMQVDHAAFMRRHPGRIYSIHLRDAKTPATAGGYLPSVPLGQGDLNFREILTAARAANIAHYVVDMQTQGVMDPIEAMRISAEYLKGLTL